LPSCFHHIKTSNDNEDAPPCSAKHIFEHALKEAKIVKTASIHSLSHSFAAHLPEGKTDNRYAKELLGHTLIRTTGYTHVARRKTLAMKNLAASWD
jgi:site-specific recombinase XerD